MSSLSSERKYSDFAIFRRLLLLARPYWLHMGGLFLLSLLSAPLALLTPLPLKIAVDSAIGSHPLPGVIDAVVPAVVSGNPRWILVLAVVMIVLITLTTNLTDLANSWLRTYTEQRLLLQFRSRMFAHAQRLSLAYHDSKGTTDSVYRIHYDASALQSIAMDGMIPFVTSAVTLTTMVYVTARLDWQLAAIALGVTPLFVAVSRSTRRHIRRQSREVKQIESSAQSVVQEVLTSLRVVKAFGREASEEGRFISLTEQGNRMRLRMKVTEGALSVAVSLIMASGTAAVLYIGVTHVQSGALTLGNLLLVMSYITQLYQPMRTVARKVVGMQTNFASAERAFEVLDAIPDVQDRPDARPLARAQGALSVQSVSFEYAGGRTALQNVSFEVPVGSRVGIAGSTGAGKTTLISLLMRFFDPTKGVIRLDGVDLRDYRLVDVRNQFSVVLQDPILFSTSIAENLAYGRPGASVAELVRAAEAANIHQFIARLPEGYETQVGERGMQLSGGERQRISLARAFLKDAPILILDEPTSSVDMKTEASIVEAMERLMQGRTTITIAHRLSTLRHCDLLLELEGGRLVDVSTGARVEQFVAHLSNTDNRR